jgi:hypothetical protein
MKAQEQKRSVSASSTKSDDMKKLLEQYGCGPVQFTGTNDALYERHLVFDNVMEVTTIGTRERFEAVARSVRDVLSQRWVRTEKTYERENAKRVYYLSMEFLIGRSLANNVTNLLLDPIVNEVVKQKNLDWYELLEQEPDAGLVMEVSGAWRLASSIPWPRCKSRPWVMACATNTASSNRPSRTAGNTKSLTIGSVAPTHGKLRAHTRRWT